MGAHFPELTLRATTGNHNLSLSEFVTTYTGNEAAYIVTNSGDLHWLFARQQTAEGSSNAESGTQVGLDVPERSSLAHCMPDCFRNSAIFPS